MIIKKVISEELLTLPEVRDMLNHIKDEREQAGLELRYEQKRAVDEMNARRESHTAEAIKEIEQGRRSAGPGRAEANNRKDEQRTSSVLSNGRDHP